MIAFAFRFPAGRYHATPWGRHANEADVAWPPEPARILRTLIATWYRKADHKHFPKALLDNLIDSLSAEPPVFRLPNAVHTHTRAYMPAPSDKKLIYDAFLRLEPNAELIVAWPGVTLTPEQTALTAHLLERLGYLGRAESWASARIVENWDGEVNACPRAEDSPPDESTTPTDIAVPLPSDAWVKRRRRFLDSARNMKRPKRTILEKTLPERLADALAVDTGDWQKAGWSSPPPLRNLVYDRSPVGPLPKFRPRRRSSQADQPGRPEAARFVLAGRPQPRIEDALKIGEIARAALMSGGGEPPPEFSGRNANGPQRDDPAHAHAFFLPEDADEDGLIDHLVVYCRYGFSHTARQRLDRLNRLWLAHGRAKDDGERGRKEWRLALEDIASPKDFAPASPLLRYSREWTSITPYLMPWHAKRNFGAVEQITREIRQRGIFPTLSNVVEMDQSACPKRAAAFHRIRSRRGLVQPDRLGCFLTLTFAESFVGPLALGFACHYGLGLFVATDEDIHAPH